MRSQSASRIFRGGGGGGGVSGDKMREEGFWLELLYLVQKLLGDGEILLTN